jgi:Outer membrane protein beta-barrel domain
MHDWSDEEMDEFSRDAADNFQPGRAGFDWSAIEKRLDAEMPIEKKKRRPLFIWFVLAALVAGGSYMAFTHGDGTKPSSTSKDIVERTGEPPSARTTRSAEKDIERKTSTDQQRTNNSIESPERKVAADPSSINSKAGSERESSLKHDAGSRRQTSLNGDAGSAPQSSLNGDATRRSSSTRDAGAPHQSSPKNEAVAASRSSDVVATPQSSNHAASSTPGTSMRNGARTTPRSPINAGAGFNVRDNSTLTLKSSRTKQKNLITSIASRPIIGSTRPGNLRSRKAKPNRQESSAVVKTNIPSDQSEGTSNAGIASDNAPSTTSDVVKEDVAKNPAPLISTQTDTAHQSIEKETAPKADATSAVAKKKQKKSSSNKKGFDFGVVAGSDLSTVNYKYVVKPGYNIGLAVNYRFPSRWGLSAAMIYTRKNYTISGSDYHVRSLPANIKVIKAEGDCAMWELPVQLTYRFATAPKHSWFVGGGISSYFMKNENYAFHSMVNGMYNYSERSYAANHNYAISMIAIDLGYEQQLSRSLSLQVRPYARLPLKDVGYGNIRLSSYGLNFQLNFTSLRR